MLRSNDVPRCVNDCPRWNTPELLTSAAEGTLAIRVDVSGTSSQVTDVIVKTERSLPSRSRVPRMKRLQHGELDVLID
jgi:hypothetical protein